MVWPTRDSGYNVPEYPTPFHSQKGQKLKRLWWIVTGQYPVKRLEGIGKMLLDGYMHRAWIKNDADGFTGWRWDKHKVDFVIVSAANRYKDIIVMGPRHYSNLMYGHIEAYGGIKLLRKYAGEDYEQGFVDQYGTFYNRVEAKKIALKRGQIRYPDNCPGTDLFSEGLC
jgi:hypothetical protein